MGSKTTIKDVAERAGVSSATVSNVMNDKGKVSESTRKTVLKAVEALNYRPNASAQRRLQKGTRSSIGLVVKEIHNPYFADVTVGVQKKAEEEGYEIMLSSSEGRRETERGIVELFVEKDVDGIIINPLLDREADLSHLFELKRRNIPFVLLEEVHGLKASLVDIDNVEAAQELTTYLIDRGHEDIIHFSGPEYSMHSEERVQGFRRTFFESGLVYSEDYVVRAGAHLRDGYETGMTYFQETDRADWPTAVTCYNDLVAIGLLRALRELEVSVPEEVSVAGFDNIEICEYAPVPLTTIGVPTEEMGQTAVEVLLRHIESEGDHTPEVVNLEPKMTVRASTAPAPTTVKA
ncbi:LacI family transcriptional regulator [Longimonas halophila]|uniref:LacI family transcriptional regulator n=1 Tax=Longimonas halophila TaxID=1469170 RepID=A0A2H3NPE9_9BACT|nr:LacI family DNA-binding transcriptional regulator [Longimonas halophila]PEN08904.1 LacI family transcriptional regulator [Longimonas halophila]